MDDNLLIARATASRKACDPGYDAEFDFEDMEDSFPLWEPLYEEPQREDTRSADPRPARRSPEECARRTAERKARNAVTRKQRYRERVALRGDSYCLGITGGASSPPVYDGMAAYWWMHAGLLGIGRLLILTRLCRDGPSTAPLLGPLIGRTPYDALSMLHGLEGSSLVCHRPGTWLTHWPRRSGLPAIRWEATETGRCYLWRAGLVSRRVVPPDCPGLLLRQNVNTDALRAIKRHVRPEFLRPAAMAIACVMNRFSPRTIPQVRRQTSLGYSSILPFILTWERLGWVVRAGTVDSLRVWEYPRLGRRRYHLLWSWTPEGRIALERHAEAMQRLLRASRYRPAEHEWEFPFTRFVGLETYPHPDAL